MLVCAAKYGTSNYTRVCSQGQKNIVIGFLLGSCMLLQQWIAMHANRVWHDGGQHLELSTLLEITSTLVLVCTLMMKCMFRWTALVMVKICAVSMVSVDIRH